MKGPDGAVYELRFAGAPRPDEVRESFEGLSVSRTTAGLTVCGRLPDQAALHGVLERGRQLGLELLAACRLEPEVDLHRTQSSPSVWPAPLRTQDS